MARSKPKGTSKGWAEGVKTAAAQAIPETGGEATLSVRIPPWYIRTLAQMAADKGAREGRRVTSKELVIEALKETQGNQVRAAKLLGITRATLRKRVDKFGIRRELNVS